MGGAVSAGEDNGDLVDNLVHAHYVKTSNTERVLRAVDRGSYYLKDERDSAYKDSAWKHGNLHLSAPCIYSEVLECLDIRPGMSVLNLGSGTGYLSTIFGLLIGGHGVNHGVEIHADAIEYAREKLQKFMETSNSLSFMDFTAPTFIHGNCLSMEPTFGLYDRVYCGAGVPEEYQKNIMRTVKVDGGIAVMPCGDQLQKAVRTGEDSWDVSNVLAVSFASLIVPGMTRRTFVTDGEAEATEEKEEKQETPNVLLPDLQPYKLQECARLQIRRSIRAKLATEYPNVSYRNLVDREPIKHEGDCRDGNCTQRADRRRQRARHLMMPIIQHTAAAGMRQLRVRMRPAHSRAAGGGDGYDTGERPDSGDDEESDGEAEERPNDNNNFGPNLMTLIHFNEFLQRMQQQESAAAANPGNNSTIGTSSTLANNNNTTRRSSSSPSSSSSSSSSSSPSSSLPSSHHHRASVTERQESLNAISAERQEFYAPSTSDQEDSGEDEKDKTLVVVKRRKGGFKRDHIRKTSRRQGGSKIRTGKSETTAAPRNDGTDIPESTKNKGQKTGSPDTEMMQDPNSMLKPTDENLEEAKPMNTIEKKLKNREAQRAVASSSITAEQVCPSISAESKKESSSSRDGFKTENGRTQGHPSTSNIIEEGQQQNSEDEDDSAQQPTPAINGEEFPALPWYDESKPEEEKEEEVGQEDMGVDSSFSDSLSSSSGDEMSSSSSSSTPHEDPEKDNHENNKNTTEPSERQASDIRGVGQEVGGSEPKDSNNKTTTGGKERRRRRREASNPPTSGNSHTARKRRQSRMTNNRPPSSGYHQDSDERKDKETRRTERMENESELEHFSRHLEDRIMNQLPLPIKLKSFINYNKPFP